LAYNTLPVPNLRRLQLLFFAHQAVNRSEKKTIPYVFHNYFEFSNTFHHYQTRSVNHIHIFRAYTSYGKQDLNYTASCMWNELPANLKCS